MAGPLAIAGITAGAQLLGQGINAATQGSMNRKTRQWNERMWQHNRNAALEDWKMQNEYNSPEAQMKRLKQAGLNPHLVYGNGADATAGPVRSSDGPSWDPDPIRFDIGAAADSALNAYYDVQVRQAQADNLQQQQKVLEMETALKAAQVHQTIASTHSLEQNTKGSAFDLSQRQRLADISAQAAEASLNQTLANTRFTLDSNERAWVMQASNLKEAVVRMANLQQQTSESRTREKYTKEQTGTEYYRRALIGYQQLEQDARTKGLNLDNEMKQLDINLKQAGIQPGDPIYFRMITQFLNKLKN